MSHEFVTWNNTSKKQYSVGKKITLIESTRGVDDTTLLSFSPMHETKSYRFMLTNCSAALLNTALLPQRVGVIDFLILLRCLKDWLMRFTNSMHFIH